MPTTIRIEKLPEIYDIYIDDQWQCSWCSPANVLDHLDKLTKERGPVLISFVDRSH